MWPVTNTHNVSTSCHLHSVACHSILKEDEATNQSSFSVKLPVLIYTSSQILSPYVTQSPWPLIRCETAQGNHGSTNVALSPSAGRYYSPPECQSRWLLMKRGNTHTSQTYCPAAIGGPALVLYSGRCPALVGTVTGLISVYQ